MTPKITLNNVNKVYHSQAGEIIALQNISLSIDEGEFMCIVGPSGCGKSTLLRIVANIYPPTSGEIIVQHSAQNKQPLNAMVFQEYAIFPWRTVLDNIAFGLEMRDVPRTERLAQTHYYLNKIGLSRFAHHYPHQLSGGMKQRVAIARALANNPELLLMDEPFGALDAQTRTLLQEELLRIWNEERKTVLYITHSIEEAILLGDRVALMTARPGQIKHIYDIDLPRPRSLKLKTSLAFNQLAQTIWEDLVIEVNKSQLLE